MGITRCAPMVLGLLIAAVQATPSPQLPKPFLVHGGEYNLTQGRWTEKEYRTCGYPDSEIPGFEFREGSYEVEVIMEAPKGMVGTFKAIAWLWEEYPKGCTMVAKGDMLSCVIPQLLPNAPYTVAVETCKEENDCVLYSDCVDFVWTKPSAPRHVIIKDRTQTTLTINWNRSFEDPDGDYNYKVVAVDIADSTTYTCRSREGSCRLENLKSATQYEITVSVSCPFGHCNNSKSLRGETLPIAPRNPRLKRSYPDALTMTFEPPTDAKDSTYIYAVSFHPPDDLNVYAGGCEKEQPLADPDCQTDLAVPETTYNFRIFVCSVNSLLCSEGKPTIANTTEPLPNHLYLARMQNGSVYTTWRSTMRDENGGKRKFRVSVEGENSEGYQTPVQMGDYSHVFTGLMPSTLYKFTLEVCDTTTCTTLNSATLTTSYTGVKLNQPTDITQTSVVVSWTKEASQLHSKGYVFVYAAPLESEGGTQQCFATKQNSCTLQNLLPDTEYSISAKTCENLGSCTALTEPMKMRTKKPDILEPPADFKVTKLTHNTLLLTWTQSPAAARYTLEYRVFLVAENNPHIPKETFICPAQIVGRNMSCLIENLYSNVNYSVSLANFPRLFASSKPTTPITVETAMEDGYALKASSIGPLFVNLSWYSNETNLDAEYTVLMNSQTTMCTSTVSLGEHTCQAMCLSPSTAYTFKLIRCTKAAGVCEDLYNIRVRTHSAYYLKPPTDVRVSSVTHQTLTLTWPEQQVDKCGSLEYRISVSAADSSDIMYRRYVCGVLRRDGNMFCTIENLYTNINYSVSVETCTNRHQCSSSTTTVTGKTEAKDGYFLNATSVGTWIATLCWYSKQTNPDTEFRVFMNSSPTAVCTSADSVGEHSCDILGLLPSTRYNFTLSKCKKEGEICESLHNLPMKTASSRRILHTLDDLRTYIRWATSNPPDPSSQLMIRVAYAKLDAPELRRLQAVSVVITPVNDGSPSDGPKWSPTSSDTVNSSKSLSLIGGTYSEPINGSWEVRLPVPQAGPNSELQSLDILLGAGLGTADSGHDYNGRLAPDTSFAIQLRLYTDLGIGTTAPSELITNNFRTGVLCGLTIELSLLVVVLCVEIALVVKYRPK